MTTTPNFTIDQARHDAYVLAVRADQLWAAGENEQAVAAMREAALLDKTYSVRATALGNAATDPRAVRPSPTIKRLIAPHIRRAGFELTAPPHWFSRQIRGVGHDISFGPGKFGGAIGAIAARTPVGEQACYFEWRGIGNRTGTIAYSSQHELELACRLWVIVFETIVVPWFDTGALSEASWPDI